MYEFKLMGELNGHWTKWFGPEFSASTIEGNTILTGSVMDQSALHGLLKKIRDLGMTLLSVNCLDDAELEKESQRREK